MNGYKKKKKKKKHLTVIFMWDELLTYFLSWKYDVIKIGKSEVGVRSGISDDDTSMSGISSISNKSRSPKLKRNRRD